MADFTKMIPFIFHFAAGVYGNNGSELRLSVNKQFEIAKKTGWSNDPDDPGGATMIDVTLGAYKEYCRIKGRETPDKDQLRNISFSEWTEILKTMYWDCWHADKIKYQGLANILVDWIWASGKGSIKRAQRIIGVKDDGIVGCLTLTALNNADPKLLFNRIKHARIKHYRNCKGAWKYLNGWLRRLNSIQPDGSFLIHNILF
ncbi:MAG: peptidoglycan domain protein [Bacteroides sp.]|nr:peptidoglycan domain protein [Bacteroides sp.]